ncbi:hypothetical protein [Hwangdonia seohaensis]|uniref:Uncharacterized protein n=1 Tax=Hwangdonia seohaensis TaxID=1240727 RepID=A0ABW3R7A0_9FLAO|nr:hypothetical protein [Hwangdonia seohaensis]
MKKMTSVLLCLRLLNRGAQEVGFKNNPLARKRACVLGLRYMDNPKNFDNIVKTIKAEDMKLFAKKLMDKVISSEIVVKPLK